MEHEWWSVAVQIMRDEAGKKPGGTGFGGGAVSRWWRLKEYKNQHLQFCDSCIEPRLWSRQMCQECGTRLHAMTNEDASRVWVKNFIAMVIQGFLAFREKIKTE